MLKFLGKELKVVATSNVVTNCNPELLALCQTAILTSLKEYPYDMFVIAHVDGNFQIRLAGYKLPENEHLDETTVIHKIPVDFEFETLWAKLDLQESFYSLTFLKPEDY